MRYLKTLSEETLKAIGYDLDKMVADFQARESEPTYCKHGRYVGHPGGPDFMCGVCEDGIPDRDYVEAVFYEELAYTIDHILHYLLGIYEPEARNDAAAILWMDYTRDVLETNSARTELNLLEAIMNERRPL